GPVMTHTTKTPSTKVKANSTRRPGLGAPGPTEATRLQGIRGSRSICRAGVTTQEIECLFELESVPSRGYTSHRRGGEVRGKHAGPGVSRALEQLTAGRGGSFGVHTVTGASCGVVQLERVVYGVSEDEQSVLGTIHLHAHVARGVTGSGYQPDV